jgi:nucleoside-diphosphate-sugar epimerase
MSTSTTPYVVLGTGQLGLAVMDELVAQGKAVTLVNRSGKVNEPLPTTVSLIQADVNDPAAVTRATQGAHVVFACVQPPYTRWPELFPALNQAVIDGVAPTGAKLVFADNLYMYGSTKGQPIREDSPYAATGRKGRTRAAIATALLDAHRTDKLRVAIGRASDFYGPRCTDSALGERVFGNILAGKTVDLLGNIDLPHTYSYIRDFAKGLVILADRPEADGQAWHIPNAPAQTSRQVAQMIADQAGVPLRYRKANRWMLMAVGLFNPMVREMVEMMYEFTEPYIVDDSRFIQTFGNIATPLPQGIAETLSWFRQHQPAQ